MRGGLGNDVLNGGLGLDWALFDQATSRVLVDLRSGSASGGLGDDTLVGIEIVDGSRYNDTLIGNDGADTLRGGDGDDELFGKGGNDQLGGKLGLDRLYGEGGDDVLSEVDTGNLLHGGEGRDQAFFRGANGSLSVDLAASTATLDGLANTLVSI